MKRELTSFSNGYLTLFQMCILASLLGLLDFQYVQNILIVSTRASLLLDPETVLNLGVGQEG